MWQEALPIRDVSSGGVAVQCGAPLSPGIIHAARLSCDSSLNTVDVRVCHVTPAPAGEGYIVGLEFLEPDGRLLELVARVLEREPTRPLLS
jgi:hypothetical protein